MPDKIEIPPERPCPFCDGTGRRQVPSKKHKYFFTSENCTHCGGSGRARIFDEVAAAVLKDGNYTYDVCDILLDDNTITHEAIIEWVGTDFDDKPESEEDIWIARGPTPTAALVAAAENANQGG